MTRTKMFRVAKKTLLVTVALSGLGYGVVIASDVENFVSPKQAAHAEIKAQDALAKHKYDQAINWGEQAVMGDPHNADYRMVLAQANLASGRFASAETLFNDVLTLDPVHQRAGLNLALTQIALDHGSDARATLDAHREQIAPADLGLAYALAGDAANGVRILEAAAHDDGATVKTRQNLALAYALAGRWDESRVTASQDLSPDVVDKRMSDWAQMAHPKAAWEQVATLLHVTPVNDPGLPYQLALQTAPNLPEHVASAPTPVAPQPVAATQPVVAPQDSTPARYETAAARGPAAPSIAQSEAQPQSEPAPQITAQAEPHIVFAQKHEVVAHYDAPAASHTAPLIRAEAAPAKRFVAARVRVKTALVGHAHPILRTAAHHSVEAHGFAVQMGAFDSPSVAHAAWVRNVRRVAELKNYDPAQSQFKLRSTAFYRLAVTGFSTHAAAVQICAKLAANGTPCFVRGVAGDRLAAWARPAGAVRMSAQHPAHSVKVATKAAKVAPSPTAKAQIAQKPTAKPVPKQMASAQRPAGGQLAAKR